MSKKYIVNCYTCQHNGQETCKGCRTLLVGEDEPYENWQLREDLETKDQRIAELEEQLKNAIVPKFKINQIVYIVDKYFDKIYELKITSIRVSRFKDKHFNSISYDGHSEESLFATKEEAQAKLEELKGEKR